MVVLRVARGGRDEALWVEDVWVWKMSSAEREDTATNCRSPLLILLNFMNGEVEDLPGKYFGFRWKATTTG